MDNHFGKQKFRSGNIPFTLFGPFDQKTDVLFKDSTDSLKTKFEFTRTIKIERNLEEYFDGVLVTEKYCSSSPSLHISSQSLVICILSSIVLLESIF